MSLHSITDTMIETSAKNAETIACQSRTIHNLIVDNDRLRTELAAANLRITKLTDDLTEAAQVADADNATVAALVSRIEDEKVTALRYENDELRRILKNCNTENLDIRSHLVDVGNEYDDQVKNLRTELAAANAKVAELTELNAKLAYKLSWE